MMSSSAIPLVLLLATIVKGHGGGMHYIIDGVIHDGYDSRVRNNEKGTIQRSWTWDSIPWEENEWWSNIPALTCGANGTAWEKSYHAPHRAGSIVSINYTHPELPDYRFGHQHGPMCAYLAACPDEGCEKVDIHAPIWFKIFEKGLKNGTWLDGYWYMKDVESGANLDVQTPKSLRPGKYLLKHDMHNLETGFNQYFTNCVQLDISGEGDKLPAKEKLVSFPQAYDKDWGVSFPPKGSGAEWFYTKKNNEVVYPLPGPPIWEG
ncbi:lytic polysaccharide monooxygenase [Aaosphaeria arxii CBS 175.79]|uniref:AA9 family lytic polysaccharide monooxygenase n=1 Tax=Aaosphaeria arxii CBS 175.79 TaxID=1450172 RepID=A0A6A5Y9F2_9PLEO|nr:lytic polysaccharide monooxygenase [Aaosphaeria arxii CBS 175.79]KAF2021440.1 lytic polysaccharide monooxygenase [Aaosphaeria arxii CBS 175.79]